MADAAAHCVESLPVHFVWHWPLAYAQAAAAVHASRLAMIVQLLEHEPVLTSHWHSASPSDG